MSTITLRNTKGSPLTNTEIDDNFSNLNTDKYESGDSPSFSGLTVDSSDSYAVDVTRPTAGNTTVRITSGSTAGNDAIFRADIGNTTGSSGLYFGDSDTSGIGRIMYEHNGDYMRFYTSSTEQLRIDSSGNVGIGATSPSVLLDLTSANPIIRLTDSDTGADTDISAANSSGSLYLDIDKFNTVASSNLQINIDGSEVMRIDSSGNVGIGTTVQANRLEVEGAVVAQGAVDSYTNDGLYLSNEGSSNFEIGAWRSGANAANLTFATDSGSDAAPVERMRITSSGNVGIGTTSPAVTLDVGGTIYSSGVIRNTNGGSEAVPSIQPGNDNDTGIYHPATNTIGFSTVGTERMRIDSSGNVGIGGAAPSGYRLEVTQNTAADLFVRTYNADTTSTSDVIHQYRVNNDAASIYIQFGDATSASAGQLQYNNSADSWTWSVGGASKFLMESDGDFHADGDVIAYSTTVSDRRLKEDIQNIEGALEKVNSINGVTFIRKHNGERSAGVIAQELLEVLPEAVKEKELALQTADGESYYVVEYDAVTGLLVEAIKELTKRVEALES